MPKVRKPLSYLDLDKANPTSIVLEKVFRDAVDYEKNIGNGFEAIVLTTPTLASKDLSAVINNKTSTKEEKEVTSRGTNSFYIRIIGPNSPHNFLPNPIDFVVTDDEECQKRYMNLIKQHSLVSTNNFNLPAKGDLVYVRLSDAQSFYSVKFVKDYDGIKIRSYAPIPDIVVKKQTSPQQAFKKGKIKKSKGNVTSYYEFRKDFSVLEPESRKKFEAFFKDLRDQKYEPIISSSKRSVKHQWNYYTKRLQSAGQQAKPCDSDHQYGFALDINFTDPSGKFVSWKSTKSKEYRQKIPESQWGTIEDWKKVAAIAETHGIRWQGSGDVVHFYDIEGNESEKKKQLKAKCKAIYYTALGEDPKQWSEDFKDLPDAITTPVEGDWSSYQQQLRDSVNKAH